MNEFSLQFWHAFHLLVSLDADLWAIIVLSLRVSITALAISVLIAVPTGALLAVRPFPGRAAVIILLNAMMGLPPVVVGLSLYLLLSQSGLLGPLQLLYTPTAMIMAQIVLITPIIAALSYQTVSELNTEYADQLKVMGFDAFDKFKIVLFDARFRLLTAILAGFGRALGEVGAVMIVGGNINHLTRVMTTAITLETSQGNLAMALGLGLILLVLSLIINIGLFALSSWAQRYSYV